MHGRRNDRQERSHFTGVLISIKLKKHYDTSSKTTPAECSVPCIYAQLDYPVSGCQRQLSYVTL